MENKAIGDQVTVVTRPALVESQKVELIDIKPKSLALNEQNPTEGKKVGDSKKHVTGGKISSNLYNF